MRKGYVFIIAWVAHYGLLAQNFTILGDASQNSGCNCFTITPDQGNQAGAFYQTHTINLTNSFDYTFSCSWGCGTNCGGNADGMVFALTSNPGSLGGEGQSLGWGNGYGSQPCSVGVEFDTWQNSGSCTSGGECDPSYNELAIMANGDVCHCDAFNTLAGYVPIQASEAAVYDCNWHTVRLTWDVNTGTYSVYFDGNLRLSYTDLNMINDWFCGNPTVYWGWSGSTGGGCELQQVCIKVISSWIAGINYESCVPTVQFTDVSTSNTSAVASWQWQFGDGDTSSEQNPLHTYPGPGVYNAQLIITDVDGCADTFPHIVTVATPIALAVTDTNPLCNGGLDGGITVTASEGFGDSAGLGGYRYNWNTGAIGPTIIGVSAGTYLVTCTDGICTTTASYTLTQPTALTATTSSTAASCGQNNGTASIVISGGTLPYSTVEWDDGAFTGTTITGLGAGIYVANFTDANGCSALLEYKATVSSLPCGYSLNTSSTNASCYGTNDGTATVTLTGANPPVTYTWTPPEANSGTLTGLPAGTYNYSIQDNSSNGPFTGTIIIGQPSPFIVSVTTSPSSCAETSSGQAVASIDSGGVQPFNYAWSGGQPDNPVASGLSPGPISVTVTDTTGCTATASAIVGSPPALTDSFVIINDSCYPSQGSLGSITAYPEGGTAPYSYAWSNNGVNETIAALMGGLYMVTITDAGGCTVTGSASVSQLSSSAITYTISHQNITCFGDSNGSITINPSGGTAPYTYAWDTASDSLAWGAYPGTTGSETGLQPLLYSVTVSDVYGCQVWDTSTVVQPDSALSASVTVKGSCTGSDDGYMALSINGGTPPYYYLGNPILALDTIMNLPAGDTSVVITDTAGCSATISASIDTLSVDSVEATVNKDTICSDDSAQICATSGFASYYWNTGDSTMCFYTNLAGNYYVTATNSYGCTAESNQVPLSVFAVSPVSISFSNDTITAFGAVIYQWYYNGILLPDDTGSMLVASSPGIYYVAVTDSNGCVAVSNNLDVTGITNLQNALSLKIYPDPAMDELNIAYQLNSATNLQISITDITGRRIANVLNEMEFSGNYLQHVNLRNLASDVYFLTVTSDSGNVNLRFVKE